MAADGNMRENVLNYYSNVLHSKEDLKTQVCCSTDAMPTYIREVLKEIDDDIIDRFYGCGSPIPPDLRGLTVLDLGCGTGRDVYILSKLVGREGRAIGIDMNEDQLAVARTHSAKQMEAFGYEKPNVEFLSGQIEDLAAIGIATNSIDVVISNCVINLSPDKESVFREIFRVLKPGGELTFSDVFTGRRIPAPLQSNSVLQGECLAGALYAEDFRRLLRTIGCLAYRVTSNPPIAHAPMTTTAKAIHPAAMNAQHATFEAALPCPPSNSGVGTFSFRMVWTPVWKAPLRTSAERDVFLFTIKAFI